jgi:LysR family transcriptional activator of dmlA
VNNLLENTDLRVFVTVVRQGSFAGAAQALGMSPAYVSKRIGVLEAALGVRLFQRTTRRVVITEDGAQAFERAQAILASLDELIEESAERRRAPSGQLRVCSSFGFGRQVVAPAIARLARAYPALQIRFEVFDRLVDPVAEGFDLDVRIGDEHPVRGARISGAAWDAAHAAGSGGPPVPGDQGARPSVWRLAAARERR